MTKAVGIKRIGALHIVEFQTPPKTECLGALMDALLRDKLVKSVELKGSKTDSEVGHNASGPVILTTTSYYLIVTASGHDDITSVISAHFSATHAL